MTFFDWFMFAVIVIGAVAAVHEIIRDPEDIIKNQDIRRMLRDE